MRARHVGALQLDRRPRRQLVHNVKERGPPRGGPESIMTQPEEAGISPVAVNARHICQLNHR